MAHHGLLSLPPELQAITCSYLDFEDLSSFSKSHRAMHPYAREEMFRRDVTTRNSSAILWAAGASGISPDYSDNALVILRLSIGQGGDVNARHYRDGGTTCTAIHVAAAHGSDVFIAELVRLGARADAFSLRLWKFLNVGKSDKGLDVAAKLHAFSKSSGLPDHCWFPLLPAMFRPENSVAVLLLQSHNSCHLAIQHKHLFVPPLQHAPQVDAAYTIHHLLAEKNIFPDQHEQIFQRFHQSIALRTPAGRVSPLMRAIQKGNERATELLLSFPQDLDAVSSLGWPILSYAVEGASWHHTPKRRDWSATVVTRLLEKGAGVNIGGPSSPLQLAVTSVVDDEIVTDPKHIKRMKSMIGVLLTHGADVNSRMARGYNVGQYVILKMRKGKDMKLLRDLCTAFLDHGLNVNDPFPDGTSILAKVLAFRTIKKRFIVELLAHGARPAPHEYDDILRRWLVRDKDQNKMLPKEVENELPVYASNFSQAAVDRAFTKLIRNNDVKHFDALRQWRQTSNPNDLLATAIQTGFSRRDVLYELPFDPAWQNRTCQSYAHLVMQGLDEGIIEERPAMEELRRLIDAGVSLGHRDDVGKTVLQWLSKIRGKFKGELEKLKAFLACQRLEQMGNEI